MTDNTDHLFHRLRAAFIRGAKFSTKQPSPSELDKAADDYADSIVAPLAALPAEAAATLLAPIEVRPFEWDRTPTRSECLCLTGYYSVMRQRNAWEVDITKTGDDHADFVGRFADRETAEQKAQERHADMIRELLVSPTSAHAGWRSHDGSGDPEVSGDTLVEVCFRDGDTAFGVVHDWDQNWQWAGSEAGLKAKGAIIAWRVHTKPHAAAALEAASAPKCPHCGGTGDASEKGRIEHCLACAGTGKTADGAVRWEVQRVSDGEWVLVSREEARRFSELGRTVRGLYPSRTPTPGTRLHQFTLTDTDPTLMASGALSIGGSHQQLAQEILHLRSSSSVGDMVEVPRDRLLKLLEYADADYVPNSIFAEFSGYAGTPVQKPGANGASE